jgi:hypothetical protein
MYGLSRIFVIIFIKQQTNFEKNMEYLHKLTAAVYIYNFYKQCHDYSKKGDNIVNFRII